MKTEWFPPIRFRLRLSALKKFLEMDTEINKKTCLEIGYGSGYVLNFLARYFNKVFGYDFSENAYMIAKERIETYMELNNIFLYDQEDKLFNEKYDYIIALEVLEHIENDIEKLSEWRIILNDNGRMILSVPAHMSKWSKHDEAVGHYRRYERNEIISKCNKSNLKIIKIWNYGFPIILALDFFLKSMGKKWEKNTVYKFSETKKEELSKGSGIRPKNYFLKLISNDIVLFPFYMLQNLYFEKDKGSAYLLLLRKN